MIVHRGYWLANASDAWVGSGVQDVTGDSGRYLGQQPEIRVRWDAIPGTLRFEAGAAYVFEGSYIDRAPGVTDEGDPAYLYVAASVRF